MTQHIENEAPTLTGQPRQEEQSEPPVSNDEQEREDKLDEAIEMTFPASDPISI